MHHSHLNSIHSTQIYLRDNLVELKKHSTDILISTSDQTQGIGRQGNHWDFYSNAIAMSFTLKPNSIPTLTPIELGILVVNFLKKEFNISIFLKWPNDLITSSGQKCGGILTQYIDSQTVIAGLGLNFGNPQASDSEVPAHYKHGLGSISENSLSLTDYKKIPVQLYQYILDNRIKDSQEVKTHFHQLCLHTNKLVSLDDDEFNYEGKFLGIGQNGEALVEINGKTKAFLSSSLKIIS